VGILRDVKKVLSLPLEDESYDVDVIMHINSVMSTLTQLGVGPASGFSIEDDDPTWDLLLNGDSRLNMVKTYVCLKVRMLFDPPQTSYLIDAMNKQIEEMEWRISICFSENLL
jgi:hypothetical protein